MVALSLITFNICLRAPNGLVISVARICTGRRKSPVSLKADWAGLKPIPRGTLPRATDYATDYAGFSARACAPHLSSIEQLAAGS